MAVLRDEEVQKNGTVLVYYAVGQKCNKGRTAEYWKLYSAFPVVHVGYHFCQDTSVLNPAHSILSELFENAPLCRFRFHIGK